MYPVSKGSTGSKRKTVRKWLGRDRRQAEIDFTLFWDAIEGKGTRHISIEVENKNLYPIAKPVGKISSLQDAIDSDLILTKNTIADIDEKHYFNWLRDKILNKQFQELAEGTGFYNLVNLPSILNHTTDTKLKDLLDNYKNSKQHKKSIDKDEKKKTIAGWNLFCELIQKDTLETITLEDIKNFELYLHNRNLSDKTIAHYKNRVSKVFNFNKKNFNDTTKLQTVLDYFDKWENLEINVSKTINAKSISLTHFNKLYDTADIQLKAVMLLCLNTGTYLKEVSRFNISDIDFEQQTLITQRYKSGHCLKIAYLWDRTIKALQEYLQTRKDKTDILFVSNHGKSKGTAYIDGQGLRTRFWKLRNKVGLLHKVEFNHLRDTLETTGKEINISQYHIDLIMGHSSGKTSERYTHRRIHNELKESCLKFEKAFFEE